MASHETESDNMTSPVNLIIRFRIPILAVVTLITAASAMVLPRLKSNDDMMRFLPQNTPDIRLFNRVNQRFGGLDVAIIGLESDNLFTHKNIGAIRTLTRRLTAVDGVYDVLSFTEIPNPQPSPDGLRVTPLVMDHIPSGRSELDALKKTVLANDNAVGNLISADGRAAMVLCFLGGSRPRIKIAEDIRQIASREWNNNNIYYAGSPFVRLYIAGGTYADLVKLTPLVALVVLLITFLIFRTTLGVFLSLGATAIAISWVMAMVALQKDGVSLVGSSLPTILMAIGGAYGMHVLAGYFNGSATTVPDRIAEMLRTVGPPVLASGATTAMGFMSFIVMDVAPLREFGLQAAIGIGIAVVLSLIFVPAVLSFQKTPPSPLRGVFTAGPLARITAFSTRNRRAVIVVSMVLVVMSGLGIRRIAPDATMETFFARNSEPDQANRFLERYFGGSSYLQVYFEGDLRSPFVLYQLQKIVEFARSLDEVENVSAITDSLVMMNEAMGGRADIPLNNRRAGSLYPFLEGTAAIDQMISREKNASLVQIRLKDISAARVEAVISQFRHFIQKEIPSRVRAVQVGPFVNPKDAQHSYSSPEQRNSAGKVILPARQTVIEQSLSTAERQMRKKELQLEVAKRVIRLARLHLNHTTPDNAIRQLIQLFSGETPRKSSLQPALEAEIQAITNEYLLKDFAFLEPEEVEAAPVVPDNPATPTAEQLEWKNRSVLFFRAMSKHATEFITERQMKQILQTALPLTSLRDPEGLDLTASVMAQSFVMKRAEVKAAHLLEKTLKILKIEHTLNAASDAPDDCRTAILWALTTLELPVFGFRASGNSGTPVLAQVTGSPVINIAICDSTISNQIKSITLATVLILLVMTLVFRSLVTAVKGMMPALLMLAISVGLMGAFAVPIDMSTSMIATIALGIGVDYSLHFLWRRKMRRESLDVTTAEVGPSIIANAIQVAAGFLVLAVSSMIPVQRFGVLIAITMALCAAATFLLLPALRAEGRSSNQ